MQHNVLELQQEDTGFSLSTLLLERVSPKSEIGCKCHATGYRQAFNQLVVGSSSTRLTLEGLLKQMVDFAQVVSLSPFSQGNILTL